MWKNNGFYYASINGRSVSLKTKNINEARKQLKILKNTEYIPAKNMKTLGYYISEYLKIRKPKFPNDQKTPWALKLLSPFYNLPVNQLNFTEIDEYLIGLKKKSLPSYNISIRAFFRYGQNNWNFPNKNITKLQQRDRIIVLTEEEEMILYNNLEGYIKDIAIVMLSSGIRRREAYMLKWEDMLWDLSMMVIEGKRKQNGSSNQRIIPIPSYLANMERKESGWVFYHPYDEKLYTRRFRLDCDKIGIRKEVTLHSLRHTFATNLIRENVNLEYVRKYLGHASLRQTTKYIHIANIDLLNVTKKLDWI